MTDERIEILTNPLGSLMLDMVAPIYDKSIITLWIFQAFGLFMSQETEFVNDDSEQYADSFISQMFPQTVTWGISLWEEEYGITPDSSKSLQQRREYLMGVMYSANRMTPYTIKQLIYGITGLECNVIEDIAPFTIKIVIYGYYSNYAEITNELNKRLPAHINYDVQMSEVEEMDNLTSTAFAATQQESYEMEVIN